MAKLEFAIRAYVVMNAGNCKALAKLSGAEWITAFRIKS